MDNEKMTKIGELISELRKSKGMTQKDLAEQLGVTDKAVSKWERGQSYPDISLIIPLSDLLGVTANELLSGKADIAENQEEYKTEEKLRVLYKQVGKIPKVKIIKNTLEEKQELVQGLIEVIPYNDMLLICNEEGKILNLEPNVIFDFDYIAGDCFFFFFDYKRGDFKSLTMEEIEFAKNDLIKRSFKSRIENIKRKDVDFYGAKSR